MWDELDVERDVAHDELERAIAKALFIDRERLTITSVESPGDFARRVTIAGVDSTSTIDRIAFYRALAQLLDTRLLVDDGEVSPFTAMLVTPDADAVRVNIDEDGVILGLYEHVDTDDVPDRLVLETSIYSTTRGKALAHTVDDYMREGKMPAPRDLDAFMAAYTPEVQDAQHTLTELLRALVHRKTTPDDERALRRTCAILRRAFPVPEDAGMFVSDILRCADAVLAEPWDPDAPA
jgi:hypothetical protein